MSESPPEDLDWRPAKSGGAVFRTHRRVDASARRIELHPSGAARVVIGTFAILAIVSLGVALVGAWVYDDVGVLIAAGLVAAAFGLLVPLLHRQLDNRRVFDVELGRYWSTRGRDLRRPGVDSLPLASVRGLQIVAERVTGGDADHEAFELNLVLDDGRRINVLDHGNLEVLHADAGAIAKLLGVPVWVAPALRGRVRAG